MIIDCDVHHARKSFAELLPYLKEPWKTEIMKYGERKMSSGILQQEGGMRWDTTPPSGGPPGSDPIFMNWHHWEFDLNSGKAICPIREKIKTYRVKVKDEYLWVDI